MCAIQTVVFFERATNLDDFLSGCRHGRLIKQACRHANRACLHGFDHELTHLLDLSRCGGFLQIVHRRDSQGRVTHQHGTIGGRGFSAQCVQVLREAAIFKPVTHIIKQIQRWRHRIRNRARHRCERHAAVPADNGRHALTDLWGHLGTGQHHAVIMRMRIDEAWRGDLALQIDFFFSRTAREIANFRDAVAIDSNIAFETIRSCAIDHRGIFNQQIKLCAHLFRLQIN